MTLEKKLAKIHSDIEALRPEITARLASHAEAADRESALLNGPCALQGVLRSIDDLRSDIVP